MKADTICINIDIFVSLNFIFENFIELNTIDRSFLSTFENLKHQTYSKISKRNQSWFACISNYNVGLHLVTLLCFLMTTT